MEFPSLFKIIIISMAIPGHVSGFPNLWEPYSKVTMKGRIKIRNILTLILAKLV